MDIISFNEGSTANGRIENFIENPDSTSGVVTVPSTIASGETITIPTGRTAILPNVQIDGTLNVDGTVFIPTGTTTSKVIPRVTSTDNAIVRFDGTTGDVQNSSITIDDNGNIGSGTQTFNGFGGSGFKNYIINGNFDIWQRGTSFKVPAGGSVYTSDRWFISNGTNQEVNILKASMSSFSLEPIPRLRISFTVAPTSGEVYVGQRMELMQELSNKTITTQVLHSSLENLSFNGYITQNFGSGGSTQVKTLQLSDTSSGDLTVKNYVRTVTLPSTKDKTIGSNYYTEYVIVLPIRSINPFSIAQVQLEEGSVATPFENRPVGLELSLCQRYYEKLTDFRYVTYMAAGNNTWISARFSVPKRVPPTMNTVSVTYANTTVIAYSDTNIGHSNIVCNATVTGQVGFIATIEAIAEL